MTTPHQHDDPLGEGIGKVLQALAVLTTVGESAARFAASGAQNRAAKAERRANTERIADGVRQQADQAKQRAYAAQQRADRRLMDLAFDNTWMANADIDVTAGLWRTAAMYAMSGDKGHRSHAVRARNGGPAQPRPVDAYARHRAAGMNVADAMKAAARDVWQHQTRTTHPTSPARATRQHRRATTRTRVETRRSARQPTRTGNAWSTSWAATRAEVARLAGVST